jgi:hypothetical protein
MKKLGKMAGLLALAAVVGFFAACEEVDYSDVVIQFISLTANGNANETSSELYLTFNKAIEGFNIADITLSNIAVSKVTLSEELEVAGNNVKYTLEINAFSSAGTVIVTVAKQGFKFEGSPKSTPLFYRVPVDFQGVEGNGTSVITTTQLFLTFDRVIPNLSKDDITLDGGPSGLLKGELSGPIGEGPVVYTLEISGLNRPGPYQVIVSVTKEGFGILPISKPVSIDYYSPPIHFMRVEADGNATTKSTRLTLTFDQEFKGLSAADITMDGIPGINRGTLSAFVYDPVLDTYKYTLPISDFTDSGILSVSVAKTGIAITNSTRTTTVYHTVSVEFLNLVANYVDGTTTSITLYFSQPIPELWPTHIELVGLDNITKGSYEAVGNTFRLDISGFTKEQSLRVTVSKAGYTITPQTQTVNIFYSTPSFTSVEGFRLWLDIMSPNNTVPYKVVLGVLSDSYPALTVKDVLKSASSNKKNVSIELSSDFYGSIGAEAFKDCTTLVSIDLKGTIVSVGESVFSGCTGLTSVTIGAGVSSTFGDSVFTGCSNLAEIKVDETNNFYAIVDGALFSISGVPAKPAVLIAYPPAIKESTFYIPIEVSSIKKAALSGCTFLASVTIPDTVNNIGDAAFKGCTGLTSITIPNSVTSLGEEVFSGCIKLATVVLGSGVTEIGKEAFYGCTSLTSTGLTATPLGSGSSVTSIGESAYKGCNKLASVKIPASVETIGTEAFSGCTSLTEIDFSGTTVVFTTIENKAFLGCSGLVTIIIPNSVTSLGEEVFSGCSKLTTINIGNSISEIGEKTLSGCTALATLKLGSGVTTITEGALAGCAKLATITVETGSSTYSAANGVLYNAGATTLAVYPPGKTGALSIASTVTIIGESAFRNCTLPASMNFGNLEITTIRNRAFYGCTGFTSIEIPRSVDTIGENAFGACTTLTSIRIAPGASTASYFAYEGVLYDSEQTILKAFPGGKTTTTQNPFVIPTTGDFVIDTIEKYAFDGANIAGVVIPDTVSYIEDYAFKDCTKLLKVVFEGMIPIGYFGGSAFPGDLKSKFYASLSMAGGTPGTYERRSGSNSWSLTKP